jgi:hypothetical protein
MKNIKKNRKLFWPLMIIVQIIVIQILSRFPDTIDRYYSEAFYQYISTFSRMITGWTIISIGDIVYMVLIFYTLGWLWKTRKNWKLEKKSQIIKLLTFMSILSMIFHLTWGLNYQRIPLTNKLNIDKKYTLEELEHFTLNWIDKTNQLHIKITKDSLEKVIIPFDNEEMFRIAVKSYQEINNQYSYLNYHHPSIKNSLFHVPLSYMGFGGYLNPFTNEAQINGMLPKYNLPTTTLHEMSHQMGYAAESEANFISVLVSINSEDTFFNYSGYTYALKYLMRSLEKLQSDKQDLLWNQINPGILKNYEETKEFWEAHINPLQPIFKSFYDRFLKLNQQKDGMEGYSKFVGILINHEKQNSD